MILTFIIVLSGTVNQKVEASADWKNLYFNEIRTAIASANQAGSGWNLDNNINRYPSFLTGFMLADLNFSGTPELLIFGDGVSASDQMGIFTIVNNNVDSIFMGWGNMNLQEYVDESFTLFKRENDGSLLYWFKSANGGEDFAEGSIYVSDKNTSMTLNFGELAKKADFIIEDEWNHDYSQIIATARIFNGRSVDEVEFNNLMDEIVKDFNRIEYEHSTLSVWDWTEWSADGTPNYWDNLSDNDIQNFLDSYISETIFDTSVSEIPSNELHEPNPIEPQENDTLISSEEESQDKQHAEDLIKLYRFNPFDYWSVGIIFALLFAWSMFAERGYILRNWVVPTFCIIAIGLNALTLN